jgi:hypothetical protein
MRRVLLAMTAVVAMAQAPLPQGDVGAEFYKFTCKDFIATTTPGAHPDPEQVNRLRAYVWMDAATEWNAPKALVDASEKETYTLCKDEPRDLNLPVAIVARQAFAEHGITTPW